MEALFLKLLNMSLSAGWLVLAVIALRIMLRQAPKWTRCLMWALVAIRLLCPFSIESALSLIPSAEPLSQEAITAEHPRLDTGIGSLNTVTAPIMERAFAPAPGDSVNPLQVYVFLGSWLWLVGAALMLLYALLSYLRLRRQVAASIPVTHDSFLCDAIDFPFILGVFRPRIYLPSSLDQPQQSHVLAHERAHLKRRDHWWKPLGWLLLSMYWFHPLLWLTYFLFCRDIELACDEKVLRSLTEEQRIDYSQALLDLARPRAAVSACPVAFGETGVKERVKSALSYKKPGFWIVLTAILAIMVIAVCLLTDPQKEEEAFPELQQSSEREAEELEAPPRSKFTEIIDKLYSDRELAMVTRYYTEDATEEFFQDTEALYAARDYDAIHELAFERRYVLMFYQDGRESEPYYLYSLDEEPSVVLKTLLESLYKDSPEVIVHNRGSADVTEAFREEMRPYYEVGDLFSIRYIIAERGYSISRGPTIIFQGDARQVNVPSSSAAPVRVQTVVDALEPLMDVSTQPAVLVSRRTSGGEVSGPYPLQNAPNLAHLANMLLTEYAYAGTAPHVDGMEEIRIECPELGWTACAYAALGEDTVELPGAWYFESLEYSGWLTASVQEENGDFLFADYYAMFRAWAFPAEGSP